MRFAGPCKNKSNWYSDVPLRVIVESADEVTDHYRRYWSNGLCVVHTSNQAVVGDVREIVIELPNSVEILIEGLIESTKTMDQGAQLSLFRFPGLPETDRRMIDVYLDSTSSLALSSLQHSSHMELDEISIAPDELTFVPLDVGDDEEFIAPPDGDGQTDFSASDESTTDFEFSHEEELLPTFETEVDDAWVENLRNNPEGVIRCCKPGLAPAEFVDGFSRLLASIPKLVALQDLSIVIFVLDHLLSVIDEVEADQAMVLEKHLSATLNRDIVTFLGKVFEQHNTSLLIRGAVVLVYAGEEGARVLFDALIAEEDEDTRQIVVQALAEIGDAALPELLRRLEKASYLENNVVSHLVHLIGALGHTEHWDAVHGFLTHDDPALRMEALSSMARLDPGKSETMLLDALDDSDPDMRRTAIEGLILAQSLEKAGLDYYMDVLKGDRIEPGETQLLVMQAVAQAYEIIPDTISGFAPIVRSIIDPDFTETPRSVLEFDNLSPEAAVGAVELLGKIGEADVLPALKELQSMGDPIVAEAAEQAIETISKKQTSP